MDTLSKQDAPRVAKTYGADEVREAIATGKLTNYYQSKVDVNTRQVVGVETLVDIESASLDQLRDIPFDEIKITPRFVHGAWSNIKLQAKFDSTTGLAKRLGKSVVAVGVEDQADWEFIRKTECNIAQGFLISRPMPGPDLPGWIRSRHSTDSQLGGKVQ